MTGPRWYEEPPPEGSWRALFKWGAPERFRHPNPRLARRLSTALGMAGEDFRAPSRLGLEPVTVPPGPALAAEAIAELEAALGPGNVRTGPYERLAAATGKSLVDLLRLRRGHAGQLPGAVLHPRDRHDLERIVVICSRRRIPMTPLGAASSVTQGLDGVAGGVAIDLTTHMDQVLGFNETNQTVTVQPGISGPRLEAALNHAPERFGAVHRYTCGHFPQSFEFSTVGGWAATRGAGQNSTYYGKIEDLVVALTCVSPSGVIRTAGHPAAATGPDTDQILLGSEGTFGVLAEVTLRVFRLMPGGPFRFSWLFPDWSSAVGAAREALQGQSGHPSLFRLSDPDETDLALDLYGAGGPMLGGLLRGLGLRPGSRCLLLGSTEGEAGFARHARGRIARICRTAGAVPGTGLVVRGWERGRFQDPYLRDALLDCGILIDTLECAVTWDALERVRRAVRAACLAQPRTLCLCHVSHAYPQGASLYFIFIARIDAIPDYPAFQAGILETIRAQGAALSHHHSIGRMAAPWLEGQLGPEQMALFRAVKRHLDPQNLMNPGGTLGLDLPAGLAR
jgi:alkyldihydroxyacetonephosphate synthase